MAVRTSSVVRAVDAHCIAECQSSVLGTVGWKPARTNKDVEMAVGHSAGYEVAGQHKPVEMSAEWRIGVSSALSHIVM